MDSEWINRQTWHHHMTPGGESLTSAPFSDYSLFNLSFGFIKRVPQKLVLLGLGIT